MIKDQNRIELQVRKGIYEEYTLRTTNTGYCLPGTLVAMTNDPQPHTVDSQAADLDGFETIVVLENALLGKTINAKSYNGESILCRRAVSGDMYLLRAVPGDYLSGNPVYAAQTPNGIYITTDSSSGKFIGWAQENFTVTSAMVDLVDDSTRDTPSTTNLNGKVVNLVRVRIGNRRGAGNADARFSVTASGTPTTNLLTITFIKRLELVTPDLTAAEIALSAGVTKGTLTKVDAATYTLAVTTTTGGMKTVTITKTGVSPAPVSVSVVKALASYTVTPVGTPTTSLAIALTTNASEVSTDLTAAQITLSAGLTKGALTKVDAANYTLAVTVANSGTSSQNLRIAHQDVQPASVSFSVVGPPEGWYGVAYNHYTEPPPFSGATTPPTEAEIKALTSKVEITGAKRNLTIGFVMNEADWRAATSDPGAYAEYACGRAFIITRSWGIPLGVVTSGFPAMSAFDQFSVVIDGVTYTGMIANSSPVVYEGTDYNWQFV